MMPIFFLAIGSSHACFGTELRVGLEADRAHQLAAFGLGFFVEEKTGIVSDFIETADPQGDLMAQRIDLRIVAAGLPVPEGVRAIDAGSIPGIGPARFWTRADIIEDLRFTTLERALAIAPRLYRAPAYGEALDQAAPPKKAARKVVNALD